MYYGIPLHIIRDLYLTVRSFAMRVKDIIRYRKATANMNEKYPDATEEELAETDRVCIICREEMVAAKKLPCGHLFHFRCLRSWLERQQACPTCRRPILDDAVPTPSPVQAQPGNDDQQRAMVWRNGHWEPLNANLDMRERPDAPEDNGGPAVVFPNLQPPPMAGNVIPGPFGTVPVILIPPDQIAVVRPPRPPRTPDFRPANIGDEHDVPRRPHSASPSTSPRDHTTISSKPIYILKSQNPIYLEPLGAEFPVVSPVLSEATDDELLDDAEIPQLRSSIRKRLSAELATLSQLQNEIATLTERLIIADSRLEALETEAGIMESFPSLVPPSGQNTGNYDEGGESDKQAGKRKI
ncbi:Synovial apoptosis inhibitor 1 [Paramicrosporidium saccamoebae]|uniref:RING-type E3 ubiquitin transferase n=1 Tax=Paramicrosporidium saccamoebae TaxID=1246581 RepID=A0A2H9TFT8_9FUNG|nr:Synovial apoptosis inhibitor 1 [Paramicrosporidium saccamoebae]